MSTIRRSISRFGGGTPWLVAAVLVGSLSMGACSSGRVSDDEKLATAENMVSAWNAMDWQRVYGLFTEEAKLHSMMSEPLVGREAIRARLSQLVEGLERIELQIVNMGVVDDVVVIERVDDFTYKGKRSRVPVVGILEIEGDQVHEWREYYDRASLMAALTPDNAGKETDALYGIIDTLQADWNSGDMEAYLDAYADNENLDLIFGDRIVHGKEAMADLFTGTWADEEAMGDFEARNVSATLLSADIAVVNGRFEHRFPDELVIGAFSHVLQRDEHGRWRIVHEHTSRKTGD